MFSGQKGHFYKEWGLDCGLILDLLKAHLTGFLEACSSSCLGNKNCAMVRSITVEATQDKLKHLVFFIIYGCLGGVAIDTWKSFSWLAFLPFENLLFGFQLNEF